MPVIGDVIARIPLIELAICPGFTPPVAVAKRPEMMDESGAATVAWTVAEDRAAEIAKPACDGTMPAELSGAASTPVIAGSRFEGCGKTPFETIG